MNNKSIIFRELQRSPSNDETDRLLLNRGVNVIVGPPNTGKTKWFRMIDFLFGNDNSPEEALGLDIATKYQSISAQIEIGQTPFQMTRSWSDDALRNKILIDGEPLSLKEFWNWIMSSLEIPIVHYPQGNPYGLRSWPELNWRSLLRHVYRRQPFWSDFADRQPESEQHAALVQFLGIASFLFSDEYRQLVEKEKQIIELQTEKDNFVTMLQRVTKEILDNEALGVALSPQSIDAAINEIGQRIVNLEEERDSIIMTMFDITSVNGGRIRELASNQAELNLSREHELRLLRDSQARLKEIGDYRNSVDEERNRIIRATEAGEILADLKVTNCPVCDRTVTPRPDKANCYLCHREIDAGTSSKESANARMAFELEQLSGELIEADQLLDHLVRDIRQCEERLESIESQLRLNSALMQPSRSAVTVLLPPEIGSIDIEVGQLRERQEQLLRIKKSLLSRDEIADEIREIQALANELEMDVRDQSRKIDFEGLSDVVTDSMNTYLNAIKKINPTSWTQGPIQFRISDKRFKFRVGGESWGSKLGGTLTLYFLIAYHYSLMCLSERPQFNYPGLLMLDFPAELEDASSVADKENFVLEPFVELLSRGPMNHCQVIAAGSSFENLEGANRIEFSRIWK